MATPVKFHQFVEDKNHGVHNLNADTLKIGLLTNANAPTAASDAILGDLTLIDQTNLQSDTLTRNSSGQTSGTYRLILADFVITASGGALPTFRHVVVWNDTPTSPVDPLICTIDRGSDITLAHDETLTLDMSQVNGLFSET